MLDVIRRNAGSWILKIILGAIVVVFVFWGIGSFRSKRLSVVAKVNGEDILVEEFQSAYAKTIERYSKMFGGSIPEDVLKQLNIKQVVLDDLINRLLVRQAASKAGIRVTDEEVRRVILGLPSFRRNGMFDKRVYELALREARLTPIQFEDMIRQQLYSDKLKGVMFSGLIVPEEEVKEYFSFENEEINVQFIKISSDDCKEDVEVSDDELKSFYEANKERYKTKPMISIRYMQFSRDDVLKQVTVSEDAMKSYYDSHLKDYELKERRKARHILIRVPEGADNATVNERLKKAKVILKEAQGGEKDFSELARQYSEDTVSAEAGGDLGFFTRGMMVKPFEDKVFSMKEGEIAGPVRTRFGFHIIKLDKIEPARTKVFDEVKADIEKSLKDAKATDILWDTANKAYDEVIALGGLDAYKKAYQDTRLYETPLFTKDEPPLMLKTAKRDVLDALFALDKGELSSLLEVPDGIIIAEATEKMPPYIPEFNDVKDKVIKGYVARKSFEICSDKAKKLAKEASKKGINEVAKENDILLEETGFFSRSKLTMANGLPKFAAKEAFSLYEDEPVSNEPVRSGNDFYILSFKERREADLSGLDEAKKKEIRRKIFSAKSSSLFKDWMQLERQRARIEVLRKL